MGEPGAGLPAAAFPDACGPPRDTTAPPASGRAPLAVVTMVYNEGDFLPLWVRHYTGQVAAEHCYVIDHGTDDGSTGRTLPPGLNVVRIPRTPQDDSRRCVFISTFCASLLTWYETVAYTDVDELLVADPDHAGSLVELAGRLPVGGVATAVGLDVIHCPDDEAPLDWQGLVSRQRGWLRFVSSMCKPVLVRRPVAWAPGFHNIDAEPVWAPLFLLHLRYVDLPRGLARLARTRAQPWVTPQAGSHQRVSDAAWRDMLLAMSRLPREEGVALRLDDPVLGSWLDQVMRSAASRAAELYRIDLHLSGDRLWRVPQRLVGLF